MIKTPKDAEREELELLLPWYVNGTLDADERTRIEAALEADADLATSLALIRDDQDAALELLQTDEAPASIEARFLAQLDGEIDRAKASAYSTGAETGLFARFGAWLNETLFGFAPRRLGMIAAAAALVIAVQAGVITSLSGSGNVDEPGYETASGDAGSVVESGQAFLIQFAEGADISALGGFLGTEKARLVDGPLQGGFFKVRFDAADARSKGDLTTLLRAKPEFFRLVLPNG